MSTSQNSRRSTRIRQSVTYQESPNDSPVVTKKSIRKSIVQTPKLEAINNENTSENESLSSKTPSKTPSKTKSRSRKASESESDKNFSPKKLRNNRTPSTRALESIVTENSPTMEKLDSKTRRSCRVRTPNTRFESIDNLLTPKKSKSIANQKIKYEEEEVKCEEEESLETIVVEDEDTFDGSNEKENIGKPTTLFDEDEDVDGKKLYSFKTPKKKESMAQLANQTPKTPRHHDPNKGTPRTPKHSRISEIQKTPTSRPSAGKCTKTPRHIRDEIRKKLQKVKYQDEESDGDFSPDGSDYNPKSSSSSEESSNSEEEEEQPVKKTQSVASRVLKTPATTRRSTRNKTDYQLILQSDDFFSTQKSKTKTSDHTLEKLKNPRLPHDELIKLLANMQMSKEHEKAVKELNEEYKSYFEKWCTLFDEGFTILLHGLGSKRNLLQAFHKEILANEHVIVVNGFFPSLTIKDILDAIISDILEMSVTNSNPHETVNVIEDEMRLLPALHIFLIVHNIDGTMLRNEKAQSVLSRLASIKNIHIIASIDHINAPLLWNNTKLSNYNFAWFDVTSYLSYTDETAYENSLLINQSGALELSSLRSVFLSLTSNARGIYVLLVKHQLNGGNSANYQGMSFKDLYSACRESFLVSSDIALRAQLTEFFDHKLAKTKRNIDGAENITIPIKNNLLQKFMNEQT